MGQLGCQIAKDRRIMKERWRSTVRFALCVVLLLAGCTWLTTTVRAACSTHNLSWPYGCSGVARCTVCGQTFAPSGHSLGSKYHDVEHTPGVGHRQYQSCSRCQTKVYTGASLTKKHGNGATGSGTCVSCGSHTPSYVTCSYPGSCVCGQTFAPPGHTLGTKYHDVAHTPGVGHRQYQTCSRCSTKVYTGDSMTKPHGSGATGSGTCASCGSHSPTYSSCNYPGSCVCGQTFAPPGHDLGTKYHDVEHTSGVGHRQYQSCSRCQTKVYTGASLTKKHGSGATGSGTCRDCGSHAPTYSHCQFTGYCECGQSFPPVGHTLGSLYWDADHTTDRGHREWNQCTRCSAVVYNGRYHTKPHGTGATDSNSCKDCGYHTWTNQTVYTHPHYWRNCTLCGKQEQLNKTDPHSGCKTCLPYTVNVENRFDNGFSVFYNETNDASTVFLNSVMLSVAGRYKTLLQCEMFWTTSHFESEMDLCKNPQSYTDLVRCAHPEHYESGHVQSRFLAQVPEKKNTTAVLWTCHFVELKRFGEDYVARSFSSGRFIALLQRAFTHKRVEQIEGTFMHEMNHQLGARDHYHDEKIPGDKTSCANRDICSECQQANMRPASCVMYDANFFNIHAADAICEPCKNEMRAHLVDHHTR